MKYLKFIKTIYNTTMQNNDTIRAVFEKDEKYRVKYENEDTYVLELPDYSFYKDHNLGIAKGLNDTYIVLEE